MDSVRDPRSALALVESGEIDLMAVGRSLIANPDWCSLVSANPDNAGIVNISFMNKIYETST